MRAWDVLTYIGAGICLLFGIAALLTNMSAPQQAATAAIGLAFGAAPYFIAGTAHRRKERDRWDAPGA